MQHNVLTLSLAAAARQMVRFVEQRLRAELEGEEIELRELVAEGGYVHRLRVNGRGVGAAIDLQDPVGDAVLNGVEPAQQRLYQRLSEMAMVHLQTA